MTNLFRNKQIHLSYIEMPNMKSIDLWQDINYNHLKQLNTNVQNIEVLSSGCQNIN